MRRLLWVTVCLWVSLPVAWAEGQGFRVTAQTDKAVYRPGETIRVTFTAENPLDEAVHIVGEFSPRDRFGTDELWRWPGPATMSGEYVGAIGVSSDFGTDVLKFTPFYQMAGGGQTTPYPRITIPPHSVVAFARQEFNVVNASQPIGPGDYMLRYALTRVETRDAAAQGRKRAATGPYKLALPLTIRAE